MAEVAALVVTNIEQQQILHLATQLEVSPQKQQEYCTQAGLLAADLPVRLRGRIEEFFSRSHGSALIISNLPMGTVPPTPQGNSTHVGQGTLLARVQAIINQRLGSMIAYETQASGQLFHDLAPSIDEGSLQTSVSYDVELDGHTEQCFSPLRPDFLSLACLRSDPSAHTYIFPAVEITQCMSPDQRDRLFEPMWETGVDTSFRMLDQGFGLTATRGPISLLQGDYNEPFITIDETLTKGLTVESQDLLDLVITLYRERRTKIVLVAGDLLILDNKRSMHGRSSYPARLDGTDRFLLRTFIAQSGRAIEFAMRADSCVILAKYS
ncbi:oxygenase [Amycolatopsis balhimycina DSM 5908]|uniref:Oxygenase n=1 Tax=Amycolatopsis balhimycina DSM 5908 TaxID=1081091 RepID=A0A428WRP8_AMYBA|nr:TauD/TfdA family dioxygenase [Amycolatopsis balhimycina]RSM45729.1 oxygenase [Amycolatopsis balhimycina DSM 5908]